MASMPACIGLTMGRNLGCVCGFFVCLVLGPVLAVAAEPTSDVEVRVQLLVPAYFYPAGEGLEYWRKWASP